MQAKKTDIFLFIYHVFWTILMAVVLPLSAIIGYKRVFHRLGLKLPPFQPRERTLWIHALSVGEVNSAIPLVKSLVRQCPERDIVFTVTTEQGMEVAQREMKGSVAALLTMPLDFWWAMRRIVKYISPAIFVLVETDIWPGLINHLKRQDIKTVLVNCRISPGTYRSYKRFGPIVRMMYQPIDLCLVQTALDMNRLISVGVNGSRIRVAGNIKLDREWAPMDETERMNWLKSLDIKPEDQVWVAGSTHEGEEALILNVFRRLRGSFPRLRLIIAPRRIERSEEVEELSARKGFRTILRTQLSYGKAPYDVLILNTLGELERIYGMGCISFVGGSLVSKGGQNLLEPASAGCPVLFGPHTEDFALIARSLVEAGGGQEVKGQEELYHCAKDLLSKPEKMNDMGRAARRFVETNKGAVDHVMEEIALLIRQGGLDYQKPSQSAGFENGENRASRGRG